MHQNFYSKLLAHSVRSQDRVRVVRSFPGIVAVGVPLRRLPRRLARRDGEAAVEEVLVVLVLVQRRLRRQTQLGKLA